MERSIEGFSQDDEGHWVAALSCGHRVHQRHTPPFQNRPWVLDAKARERRMDQPMTCSRCQERRLPIRAQAYRTTPEFTETTLPKGLLKDHSLKAGSWGVIEILAGNILYRNADGSGEILLKAGESHVVPPELLHQVELTGPLRMQITFWKV